ncbi:hypothetical protein [Methylobacterium hispanicum]|uniref:hypothetical protein n=1 Tax=Methylobacterium hispanicum TaxID=270350 RepID=UPI002F31691F
MSTNDTLAKALADVRQRADELQADHDRIVTELDKLRLAERSLAVIVEGGSLQGLGLRLDEPRGPAPREDRTGDGARPGRGPRGPRANSAKGRLRALLESAGPQGLSQAEIAQRLPDVAPATLSAYLSSMVSSGEASRRGDFLTAARPSGLPVQPSEPDADAEPTPAFEDEAENAANVADPAT